jgi:Predicted nucleotide-binding protein containing TIR-like domain
MLLKPSLFIGSSSEGVEIAEALEVVLQDSAEVTLWKDGVFGLNQNYLDSLVKAAESFDFAVLVVTPDDVTESRGVERNSPRDNILFEIGLFMGQLGKDRAFIIYNSDEDIKLPSDLAGISHAVFHNRDDGNIRAAIRSACLDIKDAIKKLGKKKRDVFSIDNHPVDEALKSLISNVSKALKFEHIDFRDEVTSHCMDWDTTSSEWAQGRVIVRQNYEKLLSNVYGSAEQCIFSTSVPDYQKTWLTSMGRSLLRIQQENKQAKSTRVFIFDERSDVTEDDRSIFEEHKNAGVDVLIYFDSEDIQFSFPVDIGRDWTTVDNGRAIAVTKQSADFYEAKWFFDDKRQATRFRRFEQKLKKGSISLADFLSDERR